MKTYKIDLHVHSKYAYRTSPALTIENILKRARDVSLDGIGTGDILHSTWRNEVKPYLNSISPHLILTTEISIKGIHYLLIFPDMPTVQLTYTKLKPLSKDIDVNGRCNVSIEYSELIDYCNVNHILIGLAHAFTPSGHYYKQRSFPTGINFIECGLDCDVNWLNYLNIAYKLTIFSDAHSLSSIGRAYIEIEAEFLDYTTIYDLFTKRNALYGVVSTVGAIGRYYETVKKIGCKDLLKPLLSTCKINEYKPRIELTIEEVTCTLYNVNKGTKRYDRYLAELKSDKDLVVYNKYKSGIHFYIEIYGGAGIKGKLGYNQYKQQ